MKNTNLTRLNTRLRAVAVFRALLKDPVVSALIRYFDTLEGDSTTEAVCAYSEFVSSLYATDCATLSEYIRSIVGDDENMYIKAVGAGKECSPQIEQAVRHELKTWQMVANLDSRALVKTLNCAEFLPRFEMTPTEIANDYMHRVENIEKYGYGIYARFRMFYLDANGTIVPVRNPDSTTLDSLIDYKREQGIILDNTKALLSGKPAANILLTGDAGTGKSSTVKAVVNELYTEGLRILEVRKDQLRQIPAILDELNQNPLKFILFIDDLSFQKDDDNYSALKAILEGSVSAKSNNVAIYATSNRRHLVKESFSDRDGDDIHRNDTMQEIISLSDRFGIHITFQKPDKNTYLDIVYHLCDAAGVTMSKDELAIKAESFALARGGRSARAAKQFVDSLIAKL